VANVFDPQRKTSHRISQKSTERIQ